MQNVDFTQFAGTWYEIYRDSGHDYWSNEKCTTAYYDLITSTSSIPGTNFKTMQLTRSSKAAFWGKDSPMTESGYI